MAATAEMKKKKKKKKKKNGWDCSNGRQTQNDRTGPKGASMYGWHGMLGMQCGTARRDEQIKNSDSIVIDDKEGGGRVMEGGRGEVQSRAEQSRRGMMKGLDGGDGEVWTGLDWVRHLP